MHAAYLTNYITLLQPAKDPRCQTQTPAVLHFRDYGTRLFFKIKLHFYACQLNNVMIIQLAKIFAQ